MGTLRPISPNKPTLITGSSFYQVFLFIMLLTSCCKKLGMVRVSSCQNTPHPWGKLVALELCLTSPRQFWLYEQTCNNCLQRMTCSWEMTSKLLQMIFCPRLMVTLFCEKWQIAALRYKRIKSLVIKWLKENSWFYLVIANKFVSVKHLLKLKAWANNWCAHHLQITIFYPHLV